MKWINGKIIFESAKEAENLANEIGNAAIIVGGMFNTMVELGDWWKGEGTHTAKYAKELMEYLNKLSKGIFEMSEEMSEKAKGEKAHGIANKKARYLTEEDLIEILTAARDRCELRDERWKMILKETFVIHNYIEDQGRRILFRK